MNSTQSNSTPVAKVSSNEPNTFEQDKPKKPKKFEPQGIPINGRQQIIDLLRALDQKTKMQILKNISRRNSSLAAELFLSGLTFQNIGELTEKDLVTFVQYLNPAIIGMALKNESKEFVQKILTALPRNYAEKAFETFTGNYEGQVHYQKRAKEKAIDTLSELYRNGILKFDRGLDQEIYV